MALGLLSAGCGVTQSPKAADAPKQEISADIKAIKDRGVLKAGVKVDVPKFGFKDPKTGKIEGFEIDLAKALAKKILGDENKLDMQGVVAKTRGPLLDNGDLDVVIATFTITEERKKQVDFSAVYFVKKYIDINLFNFIGLIFFGGGVYLFSYYFMPNNLIKYYISKRMSK